MEGVLVYWCNRGATAAASQAGRSSAATEGVLMYAAGRIAASTSILTTIRPPFDHYIY